MSTVSETPATRLAPASWLRLPRRTARLRLTLLYSGLFLLSGTCVLVLVYVLVARGSPITVQPQHVAVFARPGPAGPPSVAPAPIAARGDLGVALNDTVAAQRHADLGRLLEVSWVVLAISAIVSAVLGWFAAGRVLRPLRAMTATARTISARSLHERLALAGPEDEFKLLGDTLDGLFARLEASFEAQRRFVANASHELRTPLTVQRTLLQVALADPEMTVRQLRATCEELLVCGTEHERLLEALLTLASSERGLDHREPIDLAPLAERALDARRAEIDRRSLRVDAAFPSAPTDGDPALVERLVANLIDNATSHNVAGGWIEVRTTTGAGHATLSVANTGVVVAREEIERLFEPFQRLDGGRSAEDGHFGLGLSIVRAIAAAHDATLTAVPRPDGGLDVTVQFP